ncbi:MAG: nuclear transport factor 2 family protein [Nitrososphaerales archaeon]
MNPDSEAQIRAQVTALVRAFFEVGRTKDLAALMGLHAPQGVFSKFDENPPYTRQGSEEAFVYEQASFANVSDYEYKIEELRVDILGGGGDVAVATFYLTFTGVFVNDYSFEGMTVGSRSRVTMVASRFGAAWRIVHEHFSPFPDVSKDRALRRGQPSGG